MCRLRDIALLTHGFGPDAQVLLCCCLFTCLMAATENYEVSANLSIRMNENKPQTEFCLPARHFSNTCLFANGSSRGQTACSVSLVQLTVIYLSRRPDHTSLEVLPDSFSLPFHESKFIWPAYLEYLCFHQRECISNVCCVNY